MPTVLVTAFAAFGPHDTNPTIELVQQLSSAQWDDTIQLHTRVLPVERYRCLDELKAAIDECKPTLVIALGLAANRTRMSLERIAVNLDDFPIPDNAGVQVIDAPVVNDGPLAYVSTLPVKAILRSWQENNLSGELSYTAGTYVCNHLFYGMQHFLASSDVVSGFIHVPPLAHNGQPLDLKQQCLAIRLAIETSLKYEIDILSSAGKVD